MNKCGMYSTAQHSHTNLRKSATSSKLGSVAERPTMRVISWVVSTCRGWGEGEEMKKSAIP